MRRQLDVRHHEQFLSPLDARLPARFPIQLDAQFRALSQCQFPRHRAVQWSTFASLLLNLR